jgi:hypothetical protein
MILRSSQTTTMIRNKLLWILLFCLSFNFIHAVKFPEIFFFPFSAKYGFSLASDKGNTIDAVLTTIDIPTDKDPETFQLNWSLRLNIDRQNFYYYLRMDCNTNGDVYLSEMKDSVVRRSFFTEPLIFPMKINYNSPITIGENFSLKYMKSLASLAIKENSRTYNNVIVANLNFGDETYILYFSKGIGIVAIKTDNELFLVK